MATIFSLVLIVVIPVLAILGLVLPVMAFRRWRGNWRLAASLPMVGMGMMVLVIIMGVIIDPTSHNLWPLTLVVVAFWGLAWIMFLALLRWFLYRGTRQQSEQDE